MRPRTATVARMTRRRKRVLVVCLIVVAVVAAMFLGARAWERAFLRSLIVQAASAGPEDRAKLVAKLMQHRGRALAVLAESLGHDDAQVRQAAALACGSMGEAAHPALPALITATQDSHDRVRLNACWALGKIGGAEAVPALAECSRDAALGVRAAAARALAEIGTPPATTVPLLARLLGDESAYVRIATAAALGRLGEASARAVPALETLLDDPDRDVRQAAEEALAKIGGAQAAEDQ